MPSGLTLVMTLEEPLSLSDGEHNDLAILLHPWSWLGGSMSDPVLQLLSQTLGAKGFYTIRYNSRGVGGSSGWKSFTGLQEGLDLQEVVQWALSYVANVRHVLVVGYSHGALVAAQQPVLPNPVRTSHILLSYPLDKRALLTLFHSSAHAAALKSLLQLEGSNVLIVYGDHDEFTANESYKAWTEELRGHVGTSGMLETRLVPNGSHFWRDYDAVELRQAVETWIDNFTSSSFL
ncbi:alpha/beta-hydrolase [Schizopora paradoxa]|uniref:Alpha/beta-hydrolase n=1 Tax=Schizopora paradoxa TaxID=27342 RepID=A0A0H2RQ30_9AGAM|nr:alpha/beta-hydrolase [Schizopora paradoxa]